EQVKRQVFAQDLFSYNLRIAYSKETLGFNELDNSQLKISTA
ncbi:11167_t:CDS:1, partial [Cetraspora pellucida]